ncbi:MAG TPA: SAM-dependent methyltransferase [Caldimonas sp.]
MTYSSASAETAQVAPEDAPLAAFLGAVRAALADRTFESVVLSKPRDGADGLGAVRVRRIGLRGAAALSLVRSYATRDVTENLADGDGIAAIAAMLDAAIRPSFAHATLHTSEGETQLLVSKKGRQTLRSGPRAPQLAPVDDGDALPPHDRQRARRLPLDLPFLAELGITDERQRVVPAMARKWRQIDKFLEVLDRALDALPAPSHSGDPPAPIRVVDFGCGKGYLTFAVHEHLRRRFGVAPRVTGVELRGELVAFCNGIAERAGCTGLSFVEGDLRSFAPAAVDVMIALHACDTATDHAIDLGVRAGAAVLVCSPCCHKELRPQMARPRLLSGLLRHGVHLGQEAEMVTDSLRALLLETCGYDAKVFEFVALEHTSKNKMILATRRHDGAAQAARARAEVADLKSFYGIREQCLETLLLQRAAPAEPSQACQTP